MNVIGLYGAIGWNVVLSDNPKLLKQSEDSWTHGASVTLIKDGEHCVSISEERLSKIKYDGNFPRKSIEYCLSAANLDKNDIDLVIVPSMANQNFYKNYINKTIEKKVKRYFPKAKVEIASHHLCHAASSVFSCDYNEGSFLTLDNAGSVLFDTAGNVFACENHSFGYFNKKKNLFKYYPGIPQTNNIGNYYWMWAYHIYVNKIQKDIKLTDPYYRETFCGKVMGLSAYGNIKNLKKDWRTHFEGIPQVALESFPGRDFSYGNLSPENKAKQLQYNFENAMLEYMKELKEKDYINDNLCLAGGVFLNILANSVLRKNNVVENMHIPPFPDDTGLSFGAAAYGLFKNKEQVKLSHNISLFGKTYSDEEIEEALGDIKYKKYDNFEELCEVTAKHLANNKIVGWFQNRSEFGPRALGSRSILMNPQPKKNKDTVNSRIKHREEWRPFAGIMLEEHQKDYFVEDYPNEYMLYSLVVKPHQRKNIGAITHQDGTCRIQTVNEELHPEVTTLLRKYKEETGCPILLNTSFNDNGQPIIETPKDAIDTFNNIDLDYLCIGNYIINKNS
tara:strand:- start:1588 stop:3273 length:1686 start_codon:yes stop_codon:yes gene_type:complete